MAASMRFPLFASLAALTLAAGACGGGGSDDPPATRTISGTVTGPWVQNVTVTLGGAASRTTATSATGAYSFSGLADGSYTVAPALDGYTYVPASQSVVLAGSDRVQDFAAAAEITSFSVSGSVSYGGTPKAGRIYVRVFPSGCSGCTPIGGRSIPPGGPYTYTIRGLPVGTYDLAARWDSQGFGEENANDPVGSINGVLVAANVTGQGITLTDPPIPTPAVPTGLVAQPGNGVALVIWDTVGSPETATAYDLSWGTDAGATNGGEIAVAARDDAHYLKTGLVDGTDYYFKVRSRVGATASSYSAVVGPITSGAVASDAGSGTYSVSGTVTFGGTATGPLFVGVFDEAAGVFRVQRYPTPVASPKAFTITGVPNGNYFIFAIVDQNGNGVIDDGDISNTNGGAGPQALVAGAALTGQDFTVSGANATARVTTEHVSPATGPAFYGVDARVSSGAKRLVGATLYSGKGVRVPADLGKGWDFSAWAYGAATPPTVGDTYRFMVRYSDGSLEEIASSVTGVLDAFAQSLAEDTSSGGCSVAFPCLTWAAPASPPTSYGYRVSLGDWWYPDSSLPLPSSTLTATYGDGMNPAPTGLGTGSHTWSVSVEDADGNRARRERLYTVP